MVDKGTSCGLFNWRPEWVQRFANQKVYMALFVIIGVVQSMAFSYLTVVLSTIEKRFGLKSKEATWIYSGNEISQIFFILFLPFVGKVKRRPLFMGLSIMLSSLGLFIIAIPHFTGEQTYLVDINQQVRCFIYLKICGAMLKQGLSRTFLGNQNVTVKFNVLADPKPISHCAFSSNSIHRQIIHIAIHQLKDPEM